MYIQKYNIYQIFLLINSTENTENMNDSIHSTIVNIKNKNGHILVSDLLKEEKGHFCK